MARKPEIQYIRYYTDGSAARQLEVRQPEKKKRRPLPKQKRKPKLILRVQPLAILGVLVSVVMLFMMIQGVGELFEAQRQEQAMENHLISLKAKNEELLQTYNENIDLEDIERKALALGMVPESEVKHITISVPMPEPEEEPGVWEQISAFLTGLFA